MAAIKRFYEEMIEQCAIKHFWMSPLGYVGGYPMWLLRTRFKKTHFDPKIFVIAGFHGEEQAGPYGLLKWIKECDLKILKKIDVSLIPIINPDGFAKGQRYGTGGGPNNCGFCHIETEGDITRPEGFILRDNIDLLRPMAKDGYLSLHEDANEKRCYVYRYEDLEEPSHISREMKKTLNKYFKSCDGDQVEVDAGPGRKATVKDGIVSNHCDGSFDDWMMHLGVPRVIVTETPGKCQLKRRIEANKEVIDRFIEVVLEETQ